MEHKKQGPNRNLNLTSLAISSLPALSLIRVIGAAGGYDGSPGRYQCPAAGDDDFAVFTTDTHTGQTLRISRTDIYDYGTLQAGKSIRRSITPMVE